MNIEPRKTHRSIHRETRLQAMMPANYFLAVCSILLAWAAPLPALAELRARIVRFDNGNAEVEVQNVGDIREVILYGIVNRKSNKLTCVLRPVQSMDGSFRYFTRSDSELSEYGLVSLDSIPLDFGDVVTFSAFRGCGRLIELRIISTEREVLFTFSD